MQKPSPNITKELNNDGRDSQNEFDRLDGPATKQSTELGGEHGYDGGKKINGRKRHIFVDVMGFVLAVLVTAANIDDGVVAVELLKKIDPVLYPRLKLIWGDNKYHHHALEAWLATNRPGWTFRATKCCGNRFPPAEAGGYRYSVPSGLLRCRIKYAKFHE